MKTLTASQARIPTEAFNRVIYKGERIRIQHRSAGSAVLISEDDLKLIEQMEDLLDAAEAEKASKEFLESGEPSIPYEKIRKELGLA